jgi:hypothetical protein
LLSDCESMIYKIEHAKKGLVVHKTVIGLIAVIYYIHIGVLALGSLLTKRNCCSV